MNIPPIVDPDQEISRLENQMASLTLMSLPDDCLFVVASKCLAETRVDLYDTCRRTRDAVVRTLDRALAEKLVSIKEQGLSCIPSQHILRHDRRIIEQALVRNPEQFLDLSEEEQKDAEYQLLVFLLFKQRTSEMDAWKVFNNSSIDSCTELLQEAKEFLGVQTSLLSCDIQACPKDRLHYLRLIALLGNDECKAKLKKSSYYESIAYQHQDCEELLSFAVAHAPHAMRYAGKKLRNNHEDVLAAVRQDGFSLQYADDKLKKDREIVLAAVKQNGWALAYADETLKKDREIVLTAVKQSGSALQFASIELQQDPEILEAAKH